MKRTRMNTEWRPEINQALIRLARTDASFGVITIQLNAVFGTSFTRNAVIGRAHRLGVRRDTIDYWTDAAIEALRDLVAEDRGLDFMASALTEQFGHAYLPWRVQKQIQKLGLSGTVRPAALAGPKPKRTRATSKPDAPAPQTVPPVSIPRPLPVQAPASGLTSGPVTLIDRGPGQCCWPVNDGGPYLFCGAPKREPRSQRDTSYLDYCDLHFGKMIVKPRYRVAEVTG